MIYICNTQYIKWWPRPGFNDEGGGTSLPWHWISSVLLLFPVDRGSKRRQVKPLAASLLDALDYDSSDDSDFEVGDADASGNQPQWGSSSIHPPPCKLHPFFPHTLSSFLLCSSVSSDRTGEEKDGAQNELFKPTWNVLKSKAWISIVCCYLVVYPFRSWPSWTTRSHEGSI